MSVMLALAWASISTSAGAQQAEDANRLPNNSYEEKWSEYAHKYSKGGGHDLLTTYYFKDTVSVDEMVEAFRTHKDHKFLTSPYAGHDSVRYGLYGEQVLLTSPLP